MHHKKGMQCSTTNQLAEKFFITASTSQVQILEKLPGIFDFQRLKKTWISTLFLANLLW